MNKTKQQYYHKFLCFYYGTLLFKFIIIPVFSILFSFTFLDKYAVHNINFWGLSLLFFTLLLLVFYIGVIMSTQLNKYLNTIRRKYGSTDKKLYGKVNNKFQNYLNRDYAYLMVKVAIGLCVIMFFALLLSNFLYQAFFMNVLWLSFETLILVACLYVDFQLL